MRRISNVVKRCFQILSLLVIVSPITNQRVRINVDGSPFYLF